MNTILKLFRKIENARDTLVEYSNRSWWHSRIALLGICCLWVLSRAIYLPYLFYKLPQGRTTTRITAFALAFLMTMNAGSMGAYATGTSPSDIVEVISSAQAEPPTTPTTETPVAPPTETPVAPPTETPVAPPTETPVAPPTETPVTPPTEIPATPPDGTLVTPPDGTLVTPPDGTLVTPPDGTTVTPPDGTTVTPPDGTTVTPPEEPPACTCNHAIGTSGVEGHGEDCPLYEAPSQPDCTCPPVDSGEVVHGEDCPMYVKPAAPEPSEAVKAVLALINTLPTMDELAAVDTEGEGFADYLAQLRLDTVAARSAFDALTDEEKATFDAASLEKLTALEDVLAAMPMLLAAGDNVAMIGDAGYPSLSAAVTAATAGDDIRLTAEDATSQTITIDKNLSIELDGYSLPNTNFVVNSGTVSFSDRKGAGEIGKSMTAYDGIKIDGATVILNNIRVFSGTGTCKAIRLSSGNLTVNGGVYTGVGGNGSDAIYVVDGTLTINDGTFQSTSSRGCGLSYSGQPANLKIKKGTFFSNGGQGAFWLASGGAIDTKAKVERTFLSGSAGSYVIVAAGSTFDKDNVVIGSELFISGGFDKPENGSTDPATPAALTPTVGDSVTLEPQILGGGGNTLTYEWKKDETVISEASDPTYTIPSYTEADDGIYTVTITEEGNDKPLNIYWAVGETPPVTTDKITITVNGGTAVGGDSLSDAVSKSGVTANTITALQITAGEVTTVDWKYFAGGNPGTTTSPFTALKTFEIADTPAVTKVANIPDWMLPNAHYGVSIFPTTITSVTIPQAITVGACAFYKCSALTTVRLSAATSIGEAAFNDCTALTGVTLLKATNIGHWAFQNCTFASVSLPAVTYIGYGAFSSCKALATLKLGAAVPTVADVNAFSKFLTTRSVVIVDNDGNKLIDAATLATAITDYDAVTDGMSGSTTTDGKWYGWTLPEPVAAPKITITVNGNAPVGGADLAAAATKSGVAVNSITKLTVTKGEVTADDWKYFAGGNPGDSTSSFTALTTFEVADTLAVTKVANIPDGSSQNNIFPTSIKNVIIPKVITVGKSAFEKCTSLTTVVMPNVTTIESYAFSATALTEVNLPAAISINEAVFMECSSLSSVSLPAAKSIGSSAFQLCKALNTINLPATTDIRASAFWNCTTLNTVILPQASTIGNYAFLNCEKLATLKLGAAVPTSVNINAFEGCPAVRSLALVGTDGTTELVGKTLTDAQAAYDNVTANGNTTTDGKWYGWKVREPAAVDKITIKINDTVTEYGGASLSAAVTAAGGASAITKLTITKGVVTVEDWNYLKNLNKMTSFGINADIAKGKVVSIPDGSDAASIFPESIKNVTIMQEITVGNYAFDGCKLLDTVNLPAATVIGEYAFRNCEALTNVSLPKAIRIHQYAFGGCMALTEVLLPEAQYIRGNTFNGCKALATLKLPKATTIGASAFSGCTSLATLKLGATVPTSVNINAFEGCPAVRSLALVGTDGSPLTGTALTDAQAEYDKVVSPDTGTATDGLWFGWKVRDGSDVNVPVTGVTLNKTTLSLEAGKTAQLTEAIAPATATNKAVTWKTSNATVATVAGGLVTALKAGTATITVTTADGGKTATCAVSVKAKVISPAPGGKLEAPLTQEMVDSVFGEGNATLDGTTTPPTITIDNSITPKAPIVIDTDVTIVLGDKVITGEPGETPIFVGDNDKVTIVGPGTIAGGDSTVGSGGNGIDGGTGSDITIDGGAIVEGGNGTTGGDGITSSGNVTVDDGTVGGGNGSSGNGGDGVDTSTGTGSITIDNDGSATGGNGGNGSAGTGGNGGSGTNSGSGSTTVGGETTGGNGGSGTTAGGSGGGGSTSTGGGSVTVDGGGTTIGGAGGSGSSTGGNGGNGTSTSGTDTTINGGTTGGNGGNGTGNGSGGNGGDGAHQGSGEVDGSGTATGGNGGSGAGTGTGGTGGTGVGGGATAGSDLNVKDGISARVEVVGDAKTEVKLPDPAKTVDAVLTDAEKTDKDITDVKVTLKVDDKTAAKPNEDTIEAAKPMDSIVGAFFDITLKKAVTKTSGGTTTTDETNVTDTDSKMITITIEIPTNMRDGVEDSYVIIRVHGMGATKLATTQVGNKLTFDTDKFSTYAIAYTKSPTLPSDNTSGGSSSSNDGYDFWMEVKDEINSANSGDVIKVAAKANDKVPESTMAALRKSSGVTLVISWSGGKTITIPAGKAAKQELGRIYWPLSLLAELYAGIDLGTALTNPETGGPGKFIPVTGGELITLDAPTSAVNTIPSGTAGIQITPPDAGFEAEAFAGTEDAERTNIRNAFAVMALMLTALAVGNGVRFCKRKIGKVEE